MAGKSGRRPAVGRIRALLSEPPAGIGRPYCRSRDLPRLLPLLAADLSTGSLANSRELVALLRRALRAERVRARAGHWTYDPARHAALLRAFRIEQEALAAVERRQGWRSGGEALQAARDGMAAVAGRPRGR